MNKVSNNHNVYKIKNIMSIINVMNINKINEVCFQCKSPLICKIKLEDVQIFFL